MPSIINASTSGAGGVVTTADSSGVLQLQTASTTAVTIDTSQNVGIGTTSPATKLQVAGASGSLNARISAGNTGLDFTNNDGTGVTDLATSPLGAGGKAMTFTTYTGSASAERMRIDSSGRVTMPFQPAFRAIATNNINYTTGDTKIQVHDVTSYNVGNSYSTSTFRFTAPVAGVYMFIARAWANAGNTSSAGICFKKNGGGVGTLRVGSAPAGFFTLQPAINIFLNVNDYIELFTEEASATGIVHTSSGDANSMFAGYLLG